jgi:hypothetical protein
MLVNLAVASAESVPQAKVVESEFDYGAVEPLETHRHTFEIRNLGTAPLELSQQGTTCKCLEVESVTAVVPPGGTGAVVIAWTAKASQDIFVQRATIKTNDPLKPVIELKVLGQALMLLAIDPPELIASRVKPDEAATIDGLIYSQVLDNFALDDITKSLDGIDWKLTPATPQQLAKLNAKSGWNLQVTMPRDMPVGSFAEWLRFTANPQNRKQPIDGDLLRREVSLRGRVLRRLSVFGEGIDYDGTLNVGLLKPAQGLDRVLTVRVQDRDKDLRVTGVTTHPEFIKATLEPFPGANLPGMYRLRLQIPPGAKPGNYRNDNLGKIRLTFDHPRIDSLELGMSFVVPNERPRLQQVSLAPAAH